MAFSRLDISTKLTVLVGGLITVLTLIITLTMSFYVQESLEEENHNRCLAAAGYLARYIRAPLITNDLYAIHNYFNDTIDQNLFNYVILLAPDGKIVLHSNLAEMDEEPDYQQNRKSMQADKIKFSEHFLTQKGKPADEVFAPIIISGIRLGTLRLGHSHEKIEAMISSARIRILLFGSITAIICLAIVNVIASFLAWPAKKLTEATQRVANGDLTHPVTVHSRDELGRLAESFNIMTRELQKTTVSRDYLNNIFNSAGDAIRTINLDYDVVMANSSMNGFLNLTKQERIGKKCHQLLWAGICNSKDCVLFRIQKGEKFIQLDTEIELLDGRKQFVRMTATPLMEKDQVVGVIESIQNITEQKVAEQESKSLQKQLVQSQKMESVGRLAGGVAHDFNNILSVILGYTQLSLLSVPKDDPLADKLHQIEYASKKAESLIRQLLAFSRKQILEMTVVDLNDLVENMTKMLYRIIGEDIELEVFMPLPVRNILADQSLLIQVLMNLAVNARDAMPDGGRLIIETANVDLDVEYTFNYDQVQPGPYVMLSVSDTGIGMNKDVMDNIFEPFYTTKGPDSGTGLGLSTVYGTIKQHGGYINVYSKPGNGTTFKIYLPVTKDQSIDISPAEDWHERHGTETIMVVDDKSAIRQLILDSLGPLGYKMYEAPDANEALRLCEAIKDDIDLLITDIIMPGMNGWDMAEKFKEMRPATKIIFMSGYAKNLIKQYDLIEDNVFFIQKPITPRMLAEKMRQALDGEAKKTG